MQVVLWYFFPYRINILHILFHIIFIIYFISSIACLYLEHLSRCKMCVIGDRHMTSDHVWITLLVFFEELMVVSHAATYTVQNTALAEQVQLYNRTMIIYCTAVFQRTWNFMRCWKNISAEFNYPLPKHYKSTAHLSVSVSVEKPV